MKVLMPAEEGVFAEYDEDEDVDEDEDEDDDGLMLLY